MDENAYEIIRDGIQYKYHLGRSDMIKLIVGFWLIGLCNNIGFVVELTAAQDLIDDIHIRRMYDEDTEWHRGCTVIGTGTILLAAVVPSLFAKIFAPFLPLMIKIRYIIIIALSTSGYITTAYGYQNLDSKWIKILGIVFMSLSSGLGESSALAYIAFFPTDNALSAWSSGTGGAGFVGASIYTVLKQFGIDRTNIIMISLIWPIIMTVSFYALIPHPKIFRIKRMLNVLESQPTEGIEDMIPIIEDPHKFKVQLLMIKKTFLIYTLPFSLTFFFEYLINQALYELLYFPSELLDKHSQYRWYQSVYQYGVFAARSAINLVRIPYLYLLAILQFFNAVLFLAEALFGYLNFLAICILLCFWEGLVAGTSYVNTYARILSEISPLQRQFTMAINAVGNEIAITLAGLLSIPLYRLLCATKNPYEKRLRELNI